MSETTFWFLTILLCLSTCGDPDLWDAGTSYLMKENKTKEVASCLKHHTHNIDEPNEPIE